MANIMTNLYFIESDNHIILNKILEDIAREKKINLDEVIKFDLSERNISEVITELDTYSLFGDRKIVFAYDAIFLSPDKTDIEHDIDSFTKYINNPKEDSVLILACRKLDGKKNIAKLVKEKFKIVEPTIDFNDYVKNKTKGYKFSNSDIAYFLTCMNEDIDRINNELDKLMMLKFDDKEITKTDIDLIVIKKIDDNVNDLINAIIKKDKKRSLTIYNDIVNYGEEIFKIMIILANKIRLLLQVKILEKESDNIIADRVHLKNPKQLYYLRQEMSMYSKKELTDFLLKLAIMDEELKLGKSIDKIVFPVFIATL